MSHGSGEEENYWPGYVDALTSMVQVLAFVMMLLSMAIFVLSQNAAKNAIAAIAQAEKVSMPKNATVADLTDAIIEKIKNRSASQGAMEQARQVSAATAGAGKTAQNDSASAAPSRVVQGETATSTQSVDALTQAKRLMSAIPFERNEPSPIAADKRISVRFQLRSYAIDAKEDVNISTFLDTQRAAQKEISIGVRAHAYSGAGHLTEERRVAYYRALVIRNALIARGMLASSLQIKILDTLDFAQGLTVDIFVTEPGVD